MDPDGSIIYWPDIDFHLGWNQFLQAVDTAGLLKAQQRSEDFNRRYGAAIRKLRDDAGIPQAKVEGITERQLRRRAGSPGVGGKGVQRAAARIGWRQVVRPRAGWFDGKAGDQSRAPASQDALVAKNATRLA
jgi:hypothetical protein